MEKAIPTIFDVAREAGVARATVDRVIYHRGGVSRKTVEKVEAVIERLGYKANPIASPLARPIGFIRTLLNQNYLSV